MAELAVSRVPWPFRATLPQANLPLVQTLQQLLSPPTTVWVSPVKLNVEVLRFLLGTFAEPMKRAPLTFSPLVRLPTRTVKELLSLVTRLVTVPEVLPFDRTTTLCSTLTMSVPRPIGIHT